MSRSIKKGKVRGISTASSEKKDKQDANRKYRRITKLKAKKGNEEFPEIREVSNVWVFSKDGKIYDSSMTKKDLKK